MNWKTRIRIRRYNPLKKAVCMILDGDWDDLSDSPLGRLGIAILCVAYKEQMTGVREASTIIPYLESAGIDFTGEQLQKCLRFINEHNLIEAGKVMLDTESDASGIEWILISMGFDGMLELSKKDGQWAFKSTRKGIENAKDIIKKSKPRSKEIEK